jgi:hypothetical protein
MHGRTSGRTRPRTTQAAREVAVPYGSELVDKVSISLPPALAARARGQAGRDGTSLSAVVAEALRDHFDREDQAELDAALESDREESIRVAEAFLPFASALFDQADW